MVFELPEEIATEITKMVLGILWRSPYDLDTKLVIQKWATAIQAQMDGKPKKKKPRGEFDQQQEELF